MGDVQGFIDLCITHTLQTVAQLSLRHEEPQTAGSEVYRRRQCAVGIAVVFERDVVDGCERRFAAQDAKFTAWLPAIQIPDYPQASEP